MKHVECSPLTSQCILHPAIFKITSISFHIRCFNNPLPATQFIIPYNQPTFNGLELELAPMTFVNTSPCEIQFEKCTTPGTFFNLLEVQIVPKLLQDIIRLSHPTILDKKVNVIAPYLFQIEIIEGYINSTILFSRIAQQERSSVSTFRLVT